MNKKTNKEIDREALERLRALPMDVQRKLARMAAAKVLAEIGRSEMKKRAH